MRSWANLFFSSKLYSAGSYCGAAISLLLIGCSVAPGVSTPGGTSTHYYSQPLAESNELEFSGSQDTSGIAAADRPQATSILSANDFKVRNPRADYQPPSAAPVRPSSVTTSSVAAHPATSDTATNSSSASRPTDLSKVSIADLATGATPPPSKADLEQAAGSWFYGPGLGRTVANVGTVVAFPPYALYLLGNAGLSLAGYDQLFVTDLLPEAPKEAVLGVYDGVTSVPGRMTSLVAGRDYAAPSPSSQAGAVNPPSASSGVEQDLNASASSELNPGIALNPRPTQSSSSFPRGRLLSGAEVDRSTLERVDSATLVTSPPGRAVAPTGREIVPAGRPAVSAEQTSERNSRAGIGTQRIESEQQTSSAERKGTELNVCRNSSCRNSRQALASGRPGTHAQAGALAAREEHPVSCRNDHC